MTETYSKSCDKDWKRCS